MREYETVFILHPQADDAALDREIETVQQIITDGKGEVSGVYKWGRRKLAYPIRKAHDGIYTLIRYKAEAPVLREIDRRFKINESVLRHLTVHAVGDPNAPDIRSRERRGERGDRDRGDRGDRYRGRGDRRGFDDHDDEMDRDDRDDRDE